MKRNPSSYIRPAPEGERGCRGIPNARGVNRETVRRAVNWLLKELGIRPKYGRPKRAAPFPSGGS